VSPAWLRYRSLIDLAGQQAVWWSAVGLVQTGHSELAALPALAFVGASSWVFGVAALQLAGIGALLGAVLDTLLVQAGCLRFPSDPGRPLTTLWMVGLWAAFGLAFSGSMGWLVRRGPVIAVLFGVVAGTLAYRAGARLGPLAIAEGPSATLAIAACWALAMLALRWTARRLVPAPG